MITVRLGDARGRSKFDWLDSRHTFSFGGYQDPQHMGFRDLRVINEDRVAPGAGFPTHSHRDMEIITYVLEGTLAHKDSTGTSSVIRAGEVQRMSAGSGISHSEYNASDTEPVHFLQIWILPDERNLFPGYEQKSLLLGQNRGSWMLIGSKGGLNGSLTVHQETDVWAACFAPGEQTTFRLNTDRHAFAHVARGTVTLNGVVLGAGDGAAASQEEILEFKAAERAEVLLFDLA